MSLPPSRSFVHDGWEDICRFTVNISNTDWTHSLWPESWNEFCSSHCFLGHETWKHSACQWSATERCFDRTNCSYNAQCFLYAMCLNPALSVFSFVNYAFCCRSRKPTLDYSAVELFIDSMIPVALNLSESDFESSDTTAWHMLWEPLICGTPPPVGLLIQPCTLFGKRGQPLPSDCAIWLDIAALHSLSWSHWTDQAQVWSLLYLRNRVKVLLGNTSFPLALSRSTLRSTLSTETLGGSFPFAGPVHLDDYLDQHMLNFEVSFGFFSSVSWTLCTVHCIGRTSILFMSVFSVLGMPLVESASSLYGYGKSGRPQLAFKVFKCRAVKWQSENVLRIFQRLP